MATNKPMSTTQRKKLRRLEKTARPISRAAFAPPVFNKLMQRHEAVHSVNTDAVDMNFDDAIPCAPGADLIKTVQLARDPGKGLASRQAVATESLSVFLAQQTEMIAADLGISAEQLREPMFIEPAACFHERPNPKHGAVFAVDEAADWSQPTAANLRRLADSIRDTTLDEIREIDPAAWAALKTGDKS